MVPLVWGIPTLRRPPGKGIKTESSFLRWRRCTTMPAMPQAYASTGTLPVLLCTAPMHPPIRRPAESSPRGSNRSCERTVQCDGRQCAISTDDAPLAQASQLTRWCPAGVTRFRTTLGWPLDPNSSSTRPYEYMVARSAFVQSTVAGSTLHALRLDNLQCFTFLSFNARLPAGNIYRRARHHHGFDSPWPWATLGYFARRTGTASRIARVDQDPQPHTSSWLPALLPPRPASVPSSAYLGLCLSCQVIWSCQSVAREPEEDRDHGRPHPCMPMLIPSGV